MCFRLARVIVIGTRDYLSKGYNVRMVLVINNLFIFFKLKLFALLLLYLT